jgi:hypothetical protein
VHAGVCPPGDRCGNALAEHDRECALELVLHRPLAGLPGPSGEAGPLVGEGQLCDQRATALVRPRQRVARAQHRALTDRAEGDDR